MVHSLIARISEVQPWDPWNRGGPENQRGARVEVCKQVLECLRPFLTRLEVLQATFIPEARITNPCNWCKNPTAISTPVVNLTNCYDACAACLTEASRALNLVARGLEGEDVQGKFLPAAVIAARIYSKHADEDRRERARSRPLPTLPRLGTDDDGNIIFSLEPNPQAAGQPPQSTRTSPSIVPRALLPFAHHMITWPDLIEYLQKHGISDVPKSLKRAKAAAPKPVFSAPTRRPLYRFVSVLRVARTATTRGDAFDALQPTAWLKVKLRPPGHVPTWANIKPRTKSSPKANLPRSVSEAALKRQN